MTFRLSGKLSENAGQSVVELAAVVGLLAILAFAIFDFSRAILANNIIINMSREGASLASRTTRTPDYIMNSLAITSQPLTMDSDGMMYITEVKVEGGALKLNNGQFKTTSWKKNPPDDLSSSVDAAAIALLVEGTKTKGDKINVFEVVYRHHFFFGNLLSLPATKIMRSTTIF